MSHASSDDDRGRQVHLPEGGGGQASHLLEGMREGRRLAGELARLEAEREARRIRHRFRPAEEYGVLSKAAAAERLCAAAVGRDDARERASALLARGAAEIADGQDFAVEESVEEGGATTLSLRMPRADAVAAKKLFQELHNLDLTSSSSSSAEWLSTRDWDRAGRDLKALQAALLRAEADALADDAEQH